MSQFAGPYHSISLRLYDRDAGRLRARVDFQAVLVRDRLGSETILQANREGVAFPNRCPARLEELSGPGLVAGVEWLPIR